MPKRPRGKRVIDPATDSVRVANKAPNGEAQPYFDKSRNVSRLTKHCSRTGSSNESPFGRHGRRRPTCSTLVLRCHHGDDHGSSRPR